MNESLAGVAVVPLRARALEPRVVGLLAAAQTRLPQRRRSSRAPAIAYTYHVAPERELWGIVRGTAILGVAGVELVDGALRVRDIAVAAEARRNGLGRALLAHLHAAYGSPELLAYATEADVPFFAACGFTAEPFGAFRSSGLARIRCTLPVGRHLLGLPVEVERR